MNFKEERVAELMYLELLAKESIKVVNFANFKANIIVNIGKRVVRLARQNSHLFN